MEPIRAVLFDYHQTLVDVSRTAQWIDGAWQHLGRDGSAHEAWGDEQHANVSTRLSHVWTHIATDLDPEDRRDLDATLPAQLFRQSMGEVSDDGDFVGALYDAMLDNWVPFDDTVPTLTALQDAGVRTVLLSNIGLDLRPSLQRHGVLPHLDAVVLSYEIGAKKPDAAIFEHALRLVDVDAPHALMVGDSPRHDAAAAHLGIRTLVLPRTEGPLHGLDAVVRLVGA